jgi:hypothetical protein
MDALKIAVKYYKPIAQITHRQEVCRIYRTALREAFNWAESRKLFIEEASVIRARFDANKSLAAGIVSHILSSSHLILYRQIHHLSHASSKKLMRSWSNALIQIPI